MSKLVNNYNRKKISFKYGRGSFLYANNGIRVPDNVYSYFGTGNDLSIRHDASGGHHSYIFHHGAGAFKLASDTQMILGETGPRNYIQMNPISSSFINIINFLTKITKISR